MRGACRGALAFALAWGLLAAAPTALPVARAATHAHALESASGARVTSHLRALLAHELATPRRYHLHPYRAAVRVAWWRRPWEWIVGRLSALWNALFGRARIGPGASHAIGAAMIALAVLIVLAAFGRLIAAIQIERHRSAAGQRAVTGAEGPSELYRRALDAATRGDRVQAARWLYAATLGLLDRRGVPLARGSATVGDVRRRLRAQVRDASADFEAIALPFVAGTYAERGVDPPEWERALAAFDALQSREVAE